MILAYLWQGVVVLVATSIAVMVYAWHHSHTRASYARQLLQALLAAGATVNVPLEFFEDQHGVSVHIGEAVSENTTLLTLPRNLWLKSFRCPSTRECNGHASGSRLLLTLGKEYLQPSSQHMAAYINTLPRTCPGNLAARPEADRNLAAATTRHAWKAEVLQQDLRVLKREMAEPDGGMSRLLSCLKMSRAFNDLSEPAPVADADPTFGYCRAVMVPLFDLMNHGLDRTIRDIWSAQDGLTLLAARDLAAGEELRHPYGEPSTKARLLLSFGIRTADAPVVALEVNGLPPAWDRSRLRQQGCHGEDPEHVLLRQADGVMLNENELRAGVHCLRLRLYSRAEAAWALASGYMDQPWLEEPSKGLIEATMYEACLRKDAHVVFAAKRFCADEADDAAVEAATADGVSEDMRDAIVTEETALRACSTIASVVLRTLVERGVPGVSETVRGLEEQEMDMEQ